MICAACGAVNPSGMRYCGMCGVRLGRQAATRERRRVTMLFVDLSGFSGLTRNLDPEDLRDLADEALTSVTGVVESYDGYVDALKGDGLLALFGAPHSHPDDALRAVLAGSASLSAIEAIGKSRRLPLKARAGVNTGIVIAGAIGSGRVRAYTVMGSAVNLAARLEEAAEPGQVWVGPETYRSTRNRLHYRSTGPLSLHGFPDITSAHLLVARNRLHSDPYANVKFVGRDAEMTHIRELYDEVAASGTARELWVVGEAGRGKTRLVREFLASVGAGGRALWLEPTTGEEFSFLGLGRQVFDLRVGEEERSAAPRVQRQLEALLPGESRWQRLILASLDLAPSSEWKRAERRRVDRTGLAWRDLLLALARRNESGEVPHKPLVLVVENQPRDPALHEFLALLTHSQAPLLIVHTARRLTNHKDAQVLHLHTLAKEQALLLLAEVTGSPMREAVAQLVEQVGGVPAYVLELGRALSVASEEAFSGSLASLLQARLDMINPHHRRVLAYAALVGEVIWEGLLRELAGSTAASDVGALVAENMLVAQASSSIPNEIEYRFQSELLRNGVLRMIPYAERPVLHLRIATWLEQHAPLAFSALTAEHFELGGAHEAAYAHYLAAADLATSQDDATKAFDLYRRLSALELPPEVAAEAALAMAQSAMSLGEDGRARDALQRAEDLISACQPDDRDNLALVAEQLRNDLVMAV